MIETKITLTATAPQLAETLGKLTDPLPLMRVIGTGAQGALMEHFRTKNLTPNKRSWPKQGFWKRIRTATAFTGATADTATVTISDPTFGMRLTGGIIRAKPGKALAIPLRPEAAGILPSSKTIPGLFLLKTRRGAYLAKRDNSSFRTASKATRKKQARHAATTRRQRLTIYYILKKSVKHPADPTALPTESALTTAIIEAANEYLSSQ